MKKTFILAVSLLFLGTFAFCDDSSGTSDYKTYKTGDEFFYFPSGVRMKRNGDGETNNCYVSEISKAIGYPEGTYAFKLTAEDWISINACCAVTFTYIVKKDDVLTFFGLVKIFEGGMCNFSVEKISDNEISLKKVYDNDNKENP